MLGSLMIKETKEMIELIDYSDDYYDIALCVFAILIGVFMIAPMFILDIILIPIEIIIYIIGRKVLR